VNAGGEGADTAAICRGAKATRLEGVSTKGCRFFALSEVVPGKFKHRMLRVSY
jgi:hypothetical protein